VKDEILLDWIKSPTNSVIGILFEKKEEEEREEQERSEFFLICFA